MIHDANEIDWDIGEIVIHDSDAKKSYMLMVVVKKRKNGMIGTRYVYPGLIWNKHVNVPFNEMPRHAQRQYGSIWWNEKKYLHHPARFKIETPDTYTPYWEKGADPGKMQSITLYCSMDGVDLTEEKRKSDWKPGGEKSGNSERESEDGG